MLSQFFLNAHQEGFGLFSSMARTARGAVPDTLSLEAMARQARSKPEAPLGVDNVANACRFTDAELDPVEDDLVRILEDHPWPHEERTFRPTFLRGELHQRGHTRARIDAMLQRLIERGVFELRDYDSEFVMEFEFNRYVATRSRWLAYVAGRPGRRQLAGEVGTTPDTGDRDPAPGLKKSAPLKAPSKIAIVAYQLNVIRGVPTQKEIAEELSRRFNRPIRQGQVSRWLKQVEAFLQAGGVLPNGTDRPAPKLTSMDPARLDLGPRQDGRTKRQRGRSRDDD